ncbi:hypothetical protein ACFPVT_07855 [Corynebacterium choanae]|uniref:Uncharacterized protein n=1 Tax=Corynebacterium choanae TaxID=1862358 RepID=A0A3G6J7E0_9CORY|nr:hypothetical protein [Corynebacterium choanae]AZA14025.1 hypothetical protein CCHOA_08170 [Corynebacterium choanae]
MSVSSLARSTAFSPATVTTVAADPFVQCTLVVRNMPKSCRRIVEHAMTVCLPTAPPVATLEKVNIHDCLTDSSDAFVTRWRREPSGHYCCDQRIEARSSELHQFAAVASRLAGQYGFTLHVVI